MPEPADHESPPTGSPPNNGGKPKSNAVAWMVIATFAVIGILLAATVIVVSLAVNRDSGEGRAGKAPSETTIIDGGFEDLAPETTTTIVDGGFEDLAPTTGPPPTENPLRRHPQNEVQEFAVEWVQALASGDSVAARDMLVPMQLAQIDQELWDACGFEKAGAYDGKIGADFTVYDPSQEDFHRSRRIWGDIENEYPVSYVTIRAFGGGDGSEPTGYVETDVTVVKEPTTGELFIAAPESQAAIALKDPPYCT